MRGARRSEKRRSLGRGPWLVALGLSLLGGGAPAQAIEPYTYVVAAYGSLGGSLDADPGSGVQHTGLQLGLGVVLDEGTLLIARLGQLDLEPGEGFGPFRTARLRYLTVAGEYRFRRPLHDSGLFLGLGAYELDGRPPEGARRDQTAVGVTGGVTGDFRLARRLSAVVELAGHWADLDQANVFLTVHAGLALKF